MANNDPFAGIKQQLSQLVENKSLTDKELVQVIDAVAELINELSLAVPTKRQRLMIMLGLMRESDLWQTAYERKMHQLEQRLRPHQLEILRQVIVRGVSEENCKNKT